MMRNLSLDLRKRVICAIEEGLSARGAARRFGIGASTAIKWHQRFRNSGEIAARKQGKPPRSKLDAYEAFILGLIEDQPDTTLVEIGERLVSDHGVKAAPSTIHQFLAKRSITFKKRQRMPGSK